MMTTDDKEADRVAVETWNKVEQQSQRERLNQEQRMKLDAEINPRRHPIHAFFLVVNGITIFAGLNMCLGQIVGFAVDAVGPVQYVLRIYIIVLCLLVCLNELEWTRFTKESVLLRNWITRGLVYAFVGVLGLEENEVSPTRENSVVGDAAQGAAKNYMKTVSWVMVSVGIMYTAFGLLCLQLLYNRLRDDYKERVARAKETGRVASQYGGALGSSSQPAV